VASSEVEFREKLQSAFDSILDRVSSGSAASVISASRSGEGALYQAIFWPDKESGRVDAVTGDPIFVKWTGEVHAFFVDGRGILYMDDCRDGTTGCQTGRLDAPVDADYDGALDTLTDRDTPIVVYGDEIGQTDTSGSSAPATKGCPGSLVDGEIVFFNETNGACLKTPRALEDIEYLWSTSDWLNRLDVDNNIEYNRFVVDTTDYKFNFTAASSNPDKRFIFTWNDLNNDGIVDDSEMRDFEPGLPPLGSIIAGSLPAVLDRGPVPVDFGVDPSAPDAENQVNNIIKWIRGEDVFGMRERLVSFDKNESGMIEADEYAVWKLGDVINSTPVTVTTPAENYHQLYRDFSYADFIGRWQYRRHMIYFGANDGMLHAVNGG
jgi:type IV pilus assembly protein PilY1